MRIDNKAYFASKEGILEFDGIHLRLAWPSVEAFKAVASAWDGPDGELRLKALQQRIITAQRTAGQSKRISIKSPKQ